jgi:predicted small lipoprotein YifL
MKKAMKLLALSLVLVMMVATLASCGGPAADPDDALAALKENDYGAAKDTLVVPTALKLLGVDDIDAVVSGTNKDGEHVTIVYFKEKDAANDAWEKVKEYAEDKKDDDDSDWVIKKSGAMIYWGTSAAVKAAK